MDDQGDREYSRAPELEDLLALCKALNDHSVRYLLIGGFAVILHGYVRGTKDIDFLVDASDQNIAALKQAMSFLPDNAAALISNDDVARYQVVRIADEIVVDLLALGVRSRLRKGQSLRDRNQGRGRCLDSSRLKTTSHRNQADKSSQ